MQYLYQCEYTRLKGLFKYR